MHLTAPSHPIPTGVLWSRRAGFLLGIGLIHLGSFALARGPDGFETLKAAYFIAYGLLLTVPARHITAARAWKVFYGLLVVLSAGFVFLLVASVMFDYMAAAEEGERLGVPGFEGTLIFLALLQVPTALFERRPDLLD